MVKGERDNVETRLYICFRGQPQSSGSRDSVTTATKAKVAKSTQLYSEPAAKKGRSSASAGNGDAHETARTFQSMRLSGSGFPNFGRCFPLNI